MGGAKKTFETIWKILREIRTWQWLLILIPMLFVTATLMRFNHLTMYEMKEAVKAADAAVAEAEDKEAARTEVYARLAELRDYTTSHIVINVVENNGAQKITFGTGPIYLETLYQIDANAAVAEAQERLAVEGDENPNGNVFAKAMEVCKPLAIQNGWSWNSPGYLNCMTGEINKYPTSETLTSSLTAAVPSTALYRYDFSAPAWILSGTGIVMLFDILICLIIVVRITYWIFLRIALSILK